MLLMMLSNKESNGYASNCYFFNQIGLIRCGYGVLIIVIHILFQFYGLKDIRIITFYGKR